MGFRASHLSYHAEVRRSERLNISTEELIKLLNQGLGKNIGHSKDTRIAHRLMWSHVDNDFFIAIHNKIDGTVITILTIDMYRKNYNKNLDDTKLSKVTNQMVYMGYAPGKCWNPDINDAHVIVYAQLKDFDQISLGHWKGNIKSLNLKHLTKLPSFKEWVSNKLEKKNTKLNNVESVLAKLSGGDIQYISIN